MKSRQKSYTAPADTPATRKKRLQARLQEISDKSEKELTALMQSLEKVKTAFNSRSADTKTHHLK